MPLDANQETAVPFPRFDRLYVSVLRNRRHGKAGCGILHRLVVEAVDAAEAGSDQRFEKAPGSDACGKGHDVSGLLLAVSGYVLVKSASECDVEKLYPAADPKDRDIGIPEKTGKLELEAVAVLADLDALAGDLLAVSVRIDVDAAGEEVIRNTGTGYRISLVIALILCLVAMAVILFYKEDEVMGVINKAHAEDKGSNG